MSTHSNPDYEHLVRHIIDTLESSAIAVELEKKLTSKYFLVKKSSALWVLGGALFAMSATIGISWLAVRETLNTNVARLAQDDIAKAKVQADSDMNSIRGFLVDLRSKNQDPRFLRLGDTLICYEANKAIEMNPNSYSVHCPISFPQEFASPPTVTYSLNPESTGLSYATYQQQAQPTGFTVDLTEVQNRKGPNHILLSYIAIGKTKPEPSETAAAKGK